MTRWYIFAYVSMLFLLACTPREKIIPVTRGESNLSDLRAQIAYAAANPALYNANVGIYIESLDNNQIIFKQNEHKLFIPASNMKLFTSAAGLIKFSPEFKYRTRIYSVGQVSKGVLTGNLVIRGSGDPSITGRFSRDNDVTNIFRDWADSLLSKGISSISGNIIADDSYFQDDPLGYGWNWDDEPYWYSAEISALSINDNCVDITVTASDTIGQAPRVELFPKSHYFGIDNRAVTTIADSVRTLSVSREHVQNVITIRNKIPVNKPRYTESIAIQQPSLFFVTVLKSILEEKGISVSGEVKTVHSQPDYDSGNYKMVFTHFSPPLKDIVKALLKISHNLYAEQLLRTVGAEYGASASGSSGAKIVSGIIQNMGVPEEEFIMYDGSGLARANMVTPYAVSRLLIKMAGTNVFDAFYDALPIAGVDGTIKHRMKGSSAEGNLHAKTGYVRHVRSLSGYVDSKDNERFVFSILVNNYTIPTRAVEALQDRIGIILSQFQR